MSRLNVGALVYEYQAIDVIGLIDVLNSGSKDLAKALTLYGRVSDEAIANAPNFTFHHLGVSLDPVTVFGGLPVAPTTTVDNAPELDILIIGGPNPSDFTLHPKFADYIRKHVSAGKLLFTNCTGSFVVATTGALDGRKATINNVEYEWVKKRYPKVNWTRESKWVVDGNVWTAAGAVAGMDMAAHWLKENYGWQVLMNSTRGLDFEPRDANGVLNVIPKRYNSSGEQISTHEFFYHESY